MMLELSRRAETDCVMQACIETKQWTVEEDAIAEALAWSYEHGDTKHVSFGDRLASASKWMDSHDDSNYGIFVADEADSRIFHSALPRGFSNLDESREKIKMGAAEVVHLPPAQRAFPSRHASIKNGSSLSTKRWFKQLDSQALNNGPARKGGTLVSSIPCTKSRKNRLFRDWTPIIGTELGRTGSILSELFGRSSSDLALDDSAEFEYRGTATTEGSLGGHVVGIQRLGVSADSAITMRDIEFTDETVNGTVKSTQRRQYDESTTFSF